MDRREVANEAQAPMRHGADIERTQLASEGVTTACLHALEVSRYTLPSSALLIQCNPDESSSASAGLLADIKFGNRSFDDKMELAMT